MFRTLTIATALVVAPLVPASIQAQEAESDIVEIAIEAGSFTTLVAALQAADLVSVLQGDGPFTVFAPTDEAFAKLPAGTVEALLADKEALTRVLTYHVVSGNVGSAAAMNLDEAGTVAGINAPIEIRMGSLYIAGAKVVTADIGASNGVIHVIDAVMLPPQM